MPVSVHRPDHVLRRLRRSDPDRVTERDLVATEGRQPRRHLRDGRHGNRPFVRAAEHARHVAPDPDALLPGGGDHRRETEGSPRWSS